MRLDKDKQKTTLEKRQEERRTTVEKDYNRESTLQMAAHYAATEDEKSSNHNVVDVAEKALSQKSYSRPSSASQTDKVAISPRPQEEEQEDDDYEGTKPITRSPSSVPRDKEAQADALDALTTITTTASSHGIPTPPDGGLHAWLKVAGGFLIYINIWGFTISFGAFQSYYRTTLLSSSSPSAISWIGTMQAWLLIVIGILSGPLFDLGYFRVMLLTGNFLVVLGIMMLSLSTTYWQVFLSQGVCMGLGAGLLYIPSLALVGVWFEKKRSMALGMVMSGIAVGTLSFYFLSLTTLSKRRRVLENWSRV